MISNTTRMSLFLFLVGWVRDFPLDLSRRIGGCENWNRHVQYKAKSLGYIEINRLECSRHILRSARLTQAGLDYLCEHAPDLATYLLSVSNVLSVSNRQRDIVRKRALAIGQIMAFSAGAAFLPDQKPSLLLHTNDSTCSPSVLNRAYFYSTEELRRAIAEFEPSISSKTSRILGVIVQGHHCFCLYYTGYGRMYWQAKEEHNIIDAIDTLLHARGFKCTNYSQVIISEYMRVAESIAKQNINGVSRYFTVSDSFDHTYFLTNDANGDALLRLLVNPELDRQAMTNYLRNYIPPKAPTRSYDALTEDGLSPVILGYHFDLLKLLTLDEAPVGFRYRPILLCYDYQVYTIQRIVGHQIDVRPITEGFDE